MRRRRWEAERGWVRRMLRPGWGGLGGEDGDGVGEAMSMV